MVTELIFEDQFALQQMLKWEFKDSDLEIDIRRLKQIVVDSFNEAGAFLKLDKNPLYEDCVMEIKLLMRGLPENNTLAYFELSHLTVDSKKFCFKMYADILFPILRSGDLNYIKTIWVHEIMHMIDYRELIKNLKIYKEKIQQNTQSYSTFSIKQERKDKHVILLELIMRYRAEGIATLVEFIAGGTIHKLAAPELAKKNFDYIISNALPLINSMDYKSINYTEFYQRLNQSYYQIGAGVVLYGLMQKYPERADINKVCECLNHNCSLEELSKDSIIESIRSFDSLDFIKYCFEQEYLYEKLFELTSSYAESLQIQKGFFQVLDRIGRNIDRAGFVALMQNLIEVPLPMELMENAYNEQIVSRQVPNELRDLANILYSGLMKNNSDEVSFWALSYLFDDYDVLDDSLDYFGYIDDIEVLRTAVKINAS